jgi:REP element-mobilizing transposase RayT
MSRLRRPFLSDRYIFVTVKVLKPRRHLGEGDFQRLASAMSRMRPKHRFLLTAWVFLPDHWHGIIDPPYPLTISRARKAS